MSSFEAFPKMARLSREVVVTEKIDGTNAQVYITRDERYTDKFIASQPTHDGALYMYAGSRNRWVVPGDDNAGFANWVSDNAMALFGLGEGRHFGEWWGKGIQRNYGLDEKRFSLFNTARWNEETKPACCHVVPVMYQGDFDTYDIDEVLSGLAHYGSSAAPGFMNPEGIIVYHTAAGIGFKKTLDKNDAHKGVA